jgi:hypothetical protein
MYDVLHLSFDDEEKRTLTVRTYFNAHTDGRTLFFVMRKFR